MPTSTEWLARLREFALDRRRPTQVLDPHALGPRDDWKRRVTGGVLLQFLEFLQSEALHEHFEQLEDNPIWERCFVVITDEAGLTAAREIVDPDSDKAVSLLADEWREFLADDTTDSDDDFVHHYEFWSVWHQDLHSEWEVDLDADQEYWVHEEGFALADRAGRGAQHLWRGDGAEMVKVEEAISSWVS